MDAPITGPFAQALEGGRQRFNALFAHARHVTPSLDAAAFADHLRLVVAPIVDAVAAVAPERVAETVEVLYEFSLDLIAKDLLTRFPAVAEGWRALPRMARHLAAAPRRFAGGVTNALYNLSQIPDARPREWLEGICQFSGRGADPGALLDAGTVLAWRAGLAHYRDGALDTALRLPPDLARAALGLPDNDDDLGAAVRRLRADPWLHPQAPAAPRRLRIVRTTGAFRGFGGTFLRPPRVACADGQLLVADGEACWSLHADVFGATLQRAGDELPKSEPGGTLQFDGKGRVRCDGESRTFNELRGATSFASTANTLAVTVPLSHAVYLIARA